MWKITRRAGPGRHVLGSHMLTFDADGTVLTTEPDVASRAGLFPVAFTVEVVDPNDPSIPHTIDSSTRPTLFPQPYTAEALHDMTVAELRDILDTRDLPAPRTKAEMVARILASQEG